MSLQQLPADLRQKAREILYKKAKRWGQAHGCPCPQWRRAMYARDAIKLVLTTPEERRRAMASLAGTHSWKVRSARNLQGELDHLRNISPVGGSATRFEWRTGRRWKAGWEKAKIGPSVPQQAVAQVAADGVIPRAWLSENDRRAELATDGRERIFYGNLDGI